MTEDTEDKLRFVSPEARQFFAMPAGRGELYALVVQMTAAQVEMADAMALMLEGKTWDAHAKLLKATERLSKVQAAFAVIPGWSE